MSAGEAISADNTIIRKKNLQGDCAHDTCVFKHGVGRSVASLAVAEPGCSRDPVSASKQSHCSGAARPQKQAEPVTTLFDTSFKS
jgi:hypothetical protein